MPRPVSRRILKTSITPEGRRKIAVTLENLANNPEILDNQPKSSKSMFQMPVSENPNLKYLGNELRKPPIKEPPTQIQVLSDHKMPFKTPAEMLQERETQILEIAENALRVIGDELREQMTLAPDLSSITFDVSEYPADIIAILLTSLESWEPVFDSEGSLTLQIPKIEYFGLSAPIKSVVRPL